MKNAKLKRTVALLLATLLLLALAACANPAETAEPGAAEDGSGETYDARVALCLLGPANDGAWSSYAYNAVMSMQEQYNIDVKYTENVKPTDMEAVFTDYASQGFDLIIGHSFSFGDAALAVAEQYPDVSFAIIDGSVSADNVASYNMKTQEQGYIIGVMAAAMTESGVVGAVPGQEGPAIIKVAEAFKLGVEAQNPEVEALTTYTGSFDDAARSREAAQAMIDEGADFIMGCANQANAGMIRACQDAGIYCTGELEQQPLAEDTVVMCTLTDVEKLVGIAVEEVLNDSFTGGVHEYGFADGVLSFTGYGALEEEIPQEVKDLVEETIQKITDGEIEVPRIEEITAD